MVSSEEGQVVDTGSRISPSDALRGRDDARGLEMVAGSSEPSADRNSLAAIKLAIAFTRSSVSVGAGLGVRVLLGEGGGESSGSTREPLRVDHSSRKTGACAGVADRSVRGVLMECFKLDVASNGRSSRLGVSVQVRLLTSVGEGKASAGG